MTYSSIGILATIILLISNRDVLGNRGDRTLTQSERNYRSFLIGVFCYYITDACWGVLEAYRLTTLQFLDTAAYFAAMAAAVWLWTVYVISYLDAESVFDKILFHTGRLFFAFEIIVVFINFFRPILFWFDDTGDYHAGTARYVTLLIQILMFLVTSAYTLYTASRSEGRTRLRHLTVGLFGIAMIVMISLQVFYPLLPFYAMGYMLGTVLVHSFVVEDEKDEYRRELEAGREALTEALSAAEQASNAKTAFLSNMSHEIRTPMNAIIGLNNIAMNDPSTGDKVRGYLENIDESAQHLLGIINDILDMSRIESGRMTVKADEFSFTEALEQVNTIIGGQCRDKGLNYDCVINGHIDDYYVGDEMKLKQVMINILGNAVKFTPEGGDVKLTIEETARYDKKASVKLTMSDTGVGMSEEFLPKIFEAFTQEESSAANKYGSTGLGMPITKSLVELMNGEINVESEKGKGTTFTVTITLGISDRKDTAAAETDRSNEELEAKNERPTGQAADLSGMRVILAEDVAINAEIMTMVLSMRGIEADLAENGRGAIDLFSGHEPGYYGAILMDMRMPEVDGLEATKAIRSMGREDSESIPIIALTANAFDEDVQRSMQAGLNAHLSKPVEPESLFSTLEELCDQQNTKQ